MPGRGGSGTRGPRGRPPTHGPLAFTHRGPAPAGGGAAPEKFRPPKASVGPRPFRLAREVRPGGGPGIHGRTAAESGRTRSGPTRRPVECRGAYRTPRILRDTGGSGPEGEWGPPNGVEAPGARPSRVTSRALSPLTPRRYPPQAPPEAQGRQGRSANLRGSQRVKVPAPLP